MPQVSNAIRQIQHVVQDHGDKHTELGGGTSTKDVEWIGQLLGWTWPPTYLEIIGKFDGVSVQNAIVLSFMSSFQCFLGFRDIWHRADGFWPVGNDECGNYHALSFARRDSAGELPVVMIYHDEPAPIEYANNYAEFVIRLMREQCEYCGCSAWPE